MLPQTLANISVSVSVSIIRVDVMKTVTLAERLTNDIGSATKHNYPKTNHDNAFGREILKSHQFN